jgi:anaerobic selenocysteine-containing dehydrogenase
MNAGAVQTLLILGGNPVYDAPADLRFADALRKVRLRAHLSMYFNETSGLSQWHIPEAHYLESWSDARAHDGTVTIMQPLIAPLYNGVTAHQMLSILLNKSDATPHEIVKGYWASQGGGGDFNARWQQALHDGMVADTANLAGPAGAGSPSGAAAQAGAAPAAVPQGSFEIVFRPDPAVWDGTFSNNAWLQEMPKPQNKMTWDNAVWVSPATAQRLELATQDVVEIEHRGLKATGPVWVLPGHADDSITVHSGMGACAGRVWQPGRDSMRTPCERRTLRG